MFQSNNDINAVPSEKHQSLKPITDKLNVYPIGAFDIEGVGGPNGFLVGGVLTADDYETFRTPLDMIAYLKRRKFKKTRFFAHNLTYDYSILEPYFDKNDYPLLINGRVFKVSVHDQHRNTRWLADSLLFSGGLPLKDLGSIFNLPKIETPEAVLTFNPVMSEHFRQHLLTETNTLEYLKRDNEIVLMYMSLFQETLNELGGEMKFTLASTAMDLFRRKFLKQEYQTPFESRNTYARNAYYGGRVEPYVVGLSSKINVYDINSLYPYVMQHFEYPDPNTLVGPIENPPQKLFYHKMGVSDVTVYVPKMHIPPLPYRANGKLYFPTGILRGYYTHNELINAVNMGCKIVHVHSTLYAEKTCQPFVDYVNTLYQLRRNYKDAGDSRQHVIKIMLNSLYGKFGQRLDAGLQEIRPILWWLDGHEDLECEFREIGDIVWCLVDKHTPYQADYSNVLWASYITAYARMEILNFMSLAGEYLVYCDTDSVFIRGELETSKDLGGMKLEFQNVDVEIYGPKAYLIYEDNNILAEKCKGVPSAERLRFLLEGAVTFMRPTGLLEASHLNPKADGTPFYPAEWRNVTKHQHLNEPKRCLLTPDFAYPHQSLTTPFSVDRL